MMLLFEVADVIGGLSTVGLVVLTAVIGIQILKRQGISTLLRAQHRLQSGELPAQEILEGMMLAGAGALLLTPGFITDTLGFIFLTGPLRRPIASILFALIWSNSWVLEQVAEVSNFGPVRAIPPTQSMAISMKASIPRTDFL